MVGIIGIGQMGSGMASTLLRGFNDVQVFDIDRTRVDAAVRQGAVAAATAGELVKGCDPVLLSLPKSEILVEVVEAEVLPNLSRGQTIIDLGTTVIAETRRLAAAAREKEAFFLDAPVSGGNVGSASGSLFIFVGGNREAAQAQWALLRTLGGGRLTYCGESGAGQITKAVNQLGMGLSQAAYMEAIAYGVNAGVDAPTLVAALGGGSGFRAEMARVGNAVISGNGDGMDAKFAEFKYFLNEAHRAGFPSPILEALYEWGAQFPDTGRDNMNRPYPPYWSSLTEQPKQA